MSSTLKEYRKQAKAEAIEKRSQSGQLQPHPAPSPPVSEYHSTASVDGETEIGDSASQVNHLYIFFFRTKTRCLDENEEKHMIRTGSQMENKLLEHGERANFTRLVLGWLVGW